LVHGTYMKNSGRIQQLRKVTPSDQHSNSAVSMFNTQFFLACLAITRRAMFVERNMEAHLCNHCCGGKAISITYSECVSVALGIQHAKHIHHTILAPVACPALQYFSTLSHTRHQLQKKLLNIKCIF